MLLIPWIAECYGADKYNSIFSSWLLRKAIQIPDCKTNIVEDLYRVLISNMNSKHPPWILWKCFSFLYFESGNPVQHSVIQLSTESYLNNFKVASFCLYQFLLIRQQELASHECFYIRWEHGKHITNQTKIKIQYLLCKKYMNFSKRAIDDMCDLSSLLLLRRARGAMETDRTRAHCIIILTCIRDDVLTSGRGDGLM